MYTGYFAKIYRYLKTSRYLIEILGIIATLLVAFRSFPEQARPFFLKDIYLITALHVILLIIAMTLLTCLFLPFVTYKMPSSLMSLINTNFPLQHWTSLLIRKGLLQIVRYEVIWITILMLIIGFPIMHSYCNDYAVISGKSQSIFLLRLLWNLAISCFFMLPLTFIDHRVFLKTSNHVVIIAIFFLAADSFGIVQVNDGTLNLFKPYFSYREIAEFIIVVRLAAVIGSNHYTIASTLPVLILIVLSIYIEDVQRGSFGFAIVVEILIMILAMQYTVRTSKLFCIVLPFLLALSSAVVFSRMTTSYHFWGYGFGNIVNTTMIPREPGLILLQEWGFLGWVIVLTVFSTYILFNLSLALTLDDDSSILLMFGLVTVLSIQALQHVFMVLGYLRDQSIQFPFISYLYPQLNITLIIASIFGSVRRNMEPIGEVYVLR